MSEEKSTKQVTRVVLSPQILQRLSEWRKQIANSYPGFEPSDRDLISWAVNRTATLSKKDLSDIKTNFFDDIQELEALVSKLKTARQSGNDNLVTELLTRINFRRKSSPLPKP